MLNRGSLKDAVVYLLLLVILLAVSGGVHFMYGRSSDGLFGLFGAPLNQLEAKIVVEGRIYRNLKASGRDLGPHGQDLGALTDEERRELEKARRDMFTQIINKSTAEKFWFAGLGVQSFPPGIHIQSHDPSALWDLADRAVFFQHANGVFITLTPKDLLDLRDAFKSSTAAPVDIFISGMASKGTIVGNGPACVGYLN